MQEIVWRDTWIWDFLCSLFCSVLHFQFSYGIRSRGFLKVLSWLWLSQCSNQGNTPEANIWGNGPVPSMSEVGLNVLQAEHGVFVARCWTTEVSPGSELLVAGEEESVTLGMLAAVAWCCTSWVLCSCQTCAAWGKLLLLHAPVFLVEILVLELD